LSSSDAIWVQEERDGGSDVLQTCLEWTMTNSFTNCPSNTSRPVPSAPGREDSRTRSNTDTLRIGSIVPWLADLFAQQYQSIQVEHIICVLRE